MTACETCWGDAYARARMLGGTQVEHYQALLKERAADHDTPADPDAGQRLQDEIRARGRAGDEGMSA